MWKYGGYTGDGNVEDLLGSLDGKVAIVAGNGGGVFEELRSLLPQLKDPVIFAVNDVGMYLPRVDHWVSVHAINFPHWIIARIRQHLPAAKVHSSSYDEGVDYTWLLTDGRFSLSGYFAMQLAYLMGAGEIILCGIPGHRARRFFDLEAKTFGYGGGETRADRRVLEQLIKEMEKHPDLQAIVRSQSGLTKEFFGFYGCGQDTALACP